MKENFWIKWHKPDGLRVTQPTMSEHWRTQLRAL